MGKGVLDRVNYNHGQCQTCLRGMPMRNNIDISGILASSPFLPAQADLFAPSCAKKKKKAETRENTRTSNR